MGVSRRTPRRDDVTSVGKFGRYKTEAKERIERRGRLALRNKVKSEKHVRYIRGNK